MSQSEHAPKFTLEDAQALITECDTGERFTPNQTNFKDSAWSWDSGYIAAGLSFIDNKRAQQELINLVRSQHESGMIPHMVMRNDLPLARAKHFVAWGAGKDPKQRQMLTSGLHQPPVIGTATRVVAEQITTSEERKRFLKQMFLPLVRDHLWLLNERDPNHDGVVTIIHPWESGMDNSPSVLVGIRPKSIERYLGKLATPLRFDVKEGMDANLRTSSENGIALAGLVYRLRTRRYDSRLILEQAQPSYAIDSALMNNVLLKATKDLRWIGAQIGQDIPDEIRDYLHNGREVVQRFWNETDKRFYDIDAITGQHIKIPTISNILPLINPEHLTETQANRISTLAQNKTEFAGKYGVTTISQKSRQFNHLAYWSGPMWPWINRYLFHGANEAGEDSLARSLRYAVIQTVGKHGAYEHYSPLTGEPSGAKGFSPTAGTYIELDLCTVG